MEQKTFLNRIWDFLKSRRLSLYLLPILAITLIVGALLPQGLTLIYSSWWFMALALALFLNNLFCTLSRIRSAIKAPFHLPKQVSLDLIQKSPNHEEISFGGTLSKAMPSITSVLAARKYRLAHKKTTQGISISANKGRFGMWASLIFHSSFIIILLGILISGATNLRGSVGLTEGETFTEQHQNYRTIKEAPLFGENHQDFQVRLDKVYLSLNEKGQLTDWSSDLAVLDHDEEVKRHHVRANSPLTYQSFVFYQTPVYGYSPLFVLRDSDGNILLDAYVSLSPVAKRSLEFKDSFTITGMNPPMRIKVQFYPDARQTGRKLKTMSLIPRKPALDVEVKKGKETVFKGPVWLNQSAEFQGMRLTFAGFRFWIDFLVVRDQGIPIIFAGFWVGLFGIVLRFWYTNRNIWVLLADDASNVTVNIGGRVERHAPLFTREFAAIVEEIEERFRLLDGGSEGKR